MLTLKEVHIIFQQTEKIATPHRTPDFDEIIKAAKLGLETPVVGVLMFIEDHNTGYEGILERWRFSLDDKFDKKILFLADILPGYITTD